MPLTRNLDTGFFGTISVGTPAQKLTAFVDWTWISMWVISTTCDGGKEDISMCRAPQQIVFNQSMSSTFENVSTLYPSRTWNPSEFFGPYDFTVDYGSDIETIGPVSSRVVIQTSDIEPGLFTNTVFPFEGILGLSPVFPSDNPSTQSPFYQQWKAGQWPSPYTAFVYCYKEPKTLCDGSDGIQTFGGYDKNLARGLTWYPIVGIPEVNAVDFPFSPGIFNYWSVRITQLSLGNEVQALNTSVGGGAAGIFDYASRGRGAPLSTNAYHRLVQMSNATAITLTAAEVPNNGPQAFYQVDCSRVHSLPCIRYQFGDNKVWAIEPANYVEEVSANVCVLNVRTVGQGDFELGQLGETFLKDKYVVFDFEQNRVGLTEISY